MTADQRVTSDQRRAVLIEHDGAVPLRVSSWQTGGDSSHLAGFHDRLVGQAVEGLKGKNFGDLVNEVSERFSDHWVVWCLSGEEVDSAGLGKLVEALLLLPRHRLELWHGGLYRSSFSAIRSLGYVDLNDSVLVGAEGRQASWLLSSRCGVAHAGVFSAVPWGDGSDCMGSSWIDFGRRVTRAGGLCIAEPALLERVHGINGTSGDSDSGGSKVGRNPRCDLERFNLERFDLEAMIEHCYGERWVLFWSVSRLLYGGRRWSALWSFLARVGSAVQRSFSGATTVGGDFPEPLLREGSSSRVLPPEEAVPRAVSVVVPTFGREASLRSLFLDLEAQATEVAEVIVIEQRPEGGEAYDTDLFSGTSFRCLHHVVPWVGAGRARNVGIGSATGDWVLFVDDDVGIKSDFVTNLLDEAEGWAADAMCAEVVTPSEELRAKVAGATTNQYDVHQGVVAKVLDSTAEKVAKAGLLTWPVSVLAGCACLVRRSALVEIDGFDQRLDMGYGEDYELGVRLRLNGAVVLTTNRVALVHFHAPLGGFRALEGLDWDGKEEPKPSPYVLLSRSGLSVEMQRAYELIYILRSVASGVLWSPRQTLAMVRRLRSAHRWKERFRQRSRGGIPGTQLKTRGHRAVEVR